MELHREKINPVGYLRTSPIALGASVRPARPRASSGWTTETNWRRRGENRHLWKEL